MVESNKSDAKAELSDRQDDASAFSDRLRRRALKLDISRSELIARLGVRKQTFAGYWNGERVPPAHIVFQLSEELDCSPRWLLTGEGETPEARSLADHRLAYRGPQAEAVSDDLVEVVVSDVAYGMGGAHIDDASVETSTERFPRSFIRQFTRSPASQLYFATGIGDSMEPTIHSSDLVLIDRAHTMLRLSDQIWALHAGQIGMIKRVRVLPDGSVLLVSDNPAVSDYIAGEGELQLIGRVVAVVKKV